MAFSAPMIRNISVCGHGSTGKTTLVEELLFDAGVIPKAETVESGRTVSDFTEEEIDKKISIHASLTNLVWKDIKLNVIDTPGASDFIGEVLSAFRSTECSIMVVDGVAGIQIETLKLWRRLDERKKPRIVFINKIDLPRADFFKIVDEIRSVFKTSAIPVTIPWGQGPDYKGVINLLTMKANGKDNSESPIPADMLETAKEYHQKVVEMAAEGDDTLMEHFFEAGNLEDSEIIKGLQEGFCENHFVPVFCGSAIQNAGLKSLLDFIALAAPSPEWDDEPLADGGSIKLHDGGAFSGFIFKTSLDKFSGKMSFVKVITGKLTAGEPFNLQENLKIRISKIYTSEGKNLKETPELLAGDIGIITKVDHLKTNETIADPSIKAPFRPLALPHPVYSLAIKAENQKDDDKLAEHLQKVADQDLTFILKYNEETKETVISGMGEQHINYILEKILKENKIAVKTSVPKVPYRETITKEAEAEYTHKKQSGGHGQYGKVMIKVRPLERGKYFVFSNDIKGGSVSKGYMPGIEKGLLEAMEEGFLAGFPMVDVGVSIIDGKEHPVDSSEMAFKLAAKNALKTAFETAKAALLEPIMNLNVYVDDHYLGDILSDLSTKRGKVQDQDSLGGGIQLVRAQVPQGELMRYSIDLKAMTSGTGAFEMEFSHYDPVGGKIAQDIIAANKKESA
jgi:elongation factor G